MDHRLLLGFSHRLTLTLGALAFVACTSSQDSAQDNTGEGGSADTTGSGGGTAGSAVGLDGSFGTGGMSSGDSGVPAGGVPPRPPFDWMGVVGTGQSLSIGAQGTPVTLT